MEEGALGGNGCLKRTRVNRIQKIILEWNAKGTTSKRKPMDKRMKGARRRMICKDLTEGAEDREFKRKKYFFEMKESTVP
jgi:hypothetical protein